MKEAFKNISLAILFAAFDHIMVLTAVVCACFHAWIPAGTFAFFAIYTKIIEVRDQSLSINVTFSESGLVTSQRDPHEEPTI